MIAAAHDLNAEQSKAAVSLLGRSLATEVCSDLRPPNELSLLLVCSGDQKGSA
jgi:hypothetical protein